MACFMPREEEDEMMDEEAMVNKPRADMPCSIMKIFLGRLSGVSVFISNLNGSKLFFFSQVFDACYSHEYHVLLMPKKQACFLYC